MEAVTLPYSDSATTMFKRRSDPADISNHRPRRIALRPPRNNQSYRMPDDDSKQDVASFRPTSNSNESPLLFDILKTSFKARHITTSLRKFSHGTALLKMEVLS